MSFNLQTLDEASRTMRVHHMQEAQQKSGLAAAQTADKVLANGGDF
jgi:hypothetical protein